MMRRRWSWLAGVATMLGVGTAGAGSAPVAVEVDSRLVRPDLDLTPLVRATAEAEVQQLDLSRVPKDARLVLSVAVVRIESTKTASGDSVSCLVSATLRDEKQGAIFAVLEGRARAETPKVAPEVERAAVRAAVRGAVTKLPNAIR